MRNPISIKIENFGKEEKEVSILDAFNYESNWINSIGIWHYDHLIRITSKMDSFNYNQLMKFIASQEMIIDKVYVLGSNEKQLDNPLYLEWRDIGLYDRINNDSIFLNEDDPEKGERHLKNVNVINMGFPLNGFTKITTTINADSFLHIALYPSNK